MQLPAAETYYTHVDVKIVNDLKAAIDELRSNVRELERKHAQMEDRLQMYESDGR
jgi:phage shock protein A